LLELQSCFRHIGKTEGTARHVLEELPSFAAPEGEQRLNGFSEATRLKLYQLAQQAAQEPDPRLHRFSTLLAESLGEGVTVPERKSVTVEDVLPLLADADPARGENVFFERTRSNCLNCHRVGDRGTDFAPSLSDIGRRLKPPEILGGNGQRQSKHPRIPIGGKRLASVAKQSDATDIRTDRASMISS
jgi:hypothetical protein